jgi:ribosome-associated heat shock protein Hsp15
MQAVRIDKWLWAARFFKTRSLATEAIAGGRVHVNGVRVKPSKEIGPGDTVEVSFGQGHRIEAVVRDVAERRGPAKQAALLYEETEGSAEARERHRAEMRLTAPPQPDRGAGRPTKRDRRRLEATRGRR